jgi:hypothetical protein
MSIYSPVYNLLEWEIGYKVDYILPREVDYKVLN